MYLTFQGPKAATALNGFYPRRPGRYLGPKVDEKSTRYPYR